MAALITNKQARNRKETFSHVERYADFEHAQRGKTAAIGHTFTMIGAKLCLPKSIGQTKLWLLVNNQNTSLTTLATALLQKMGGDAAGANLRAASYTANNLTKPES